MRFNFFRMNDSTVLYFQRIKGRILLECQLTMESKNKE